MDWPLLYAAISDAVKIPLVATGVGGLIGATIGSLCTHHFTRKRELEKLLREKAEALIVTLSLSHYRLVAWRLALIRQAERAAPLPVDVERPTAIIHDLEQASAIQRLYFPALRGRLEALENTLISYITWLEEQWDQQDKIFGEWRERFSAKEATPMHEAYQEAYHTTVAAIVDAVPSARRVSGALSRLRGNVPV